MFDLEEAISEWRRQMLAAGIKTPVPLEELEIHLRDEIEARAKPGLNEEEIFHFAVSQIGQAGVLKGEFAKVGGAILEQTRHFVFTFFGIPNPQLVTTMNTTHSDIEPARATYFKATAFLAPALLLWLFSVVFIVPRLMKICQEAGTPVFIFDGLPGILKMWGEVARTTVSLTHYGVFIGGAIILTLILLEWRNDNWPRYRRAAIGAGVFLFNAIVLLAITWMLVSALVAAPRLVKALHSSLSNTYPDASKGVTFDPVIEREVNKLVSEFPVEPDLSTPEAACAAWQRASAHKDAQAISRLSLVPLDPATIEDFFYRTEEARDPQGLAIYLKALEESKIVKVQTWRGDLANVITFLPFPPGKGAAPYSARTFGRINGEWKNLGENRLPTLEAASVDFEEKNERLWQQFEELKKNHPLPPALAP